MIRSAFLLSLPLALACNLGGKPVTDDSTTGDDTGDTNTGSDTTIADIRTGVAPLDTRVTVEHVIVTSPHTQGDEGFFVQDAGGGANSGIYVWSYDGVGDIFAEPGDEVTITGTPTDYYGWTEFAVESVEITGTGTIPAPVDLGDGSAVTDWDPYESVLVSLTAQDVSSINEYGTGTLSPATTDPDAPFTLDNGFYDYDVMCGATYPSVTGVVFFSYSAYSINPRDTSDLTTPELGATVDATCAEIQAGVCGAVSVYDVVVTSETWSDEDGEHFFVQDEGGGEWTGLTVVVSSGTPNVHIGDTISATGATTELFGLTQLVLASADDIEVTGSSTPVSTVLTEIPTDYESWESCLITMTGVDVTSDESYGEVTTSWGVSVDDTFYAFDAVNGDHWDSVTGPVTYSYSTWKIEPRDASDLH